jgi:hypothetical protein
VGGPKTRYFPQYRGKSAYLHAIFKRRISGFASTCRAKKRDKTARKIIASIAIVRIVRVIALRGGFGWESFYVAHHSAS